MNTKALKCFQTQKITLKSIAYYNYNTSNNIQYISMLYTSLKTFYMYCVYNRDISVNTGLYIS